MAPSFYSLAFSYLSLFLYGLIDNMRGPVFPDLLKKFNLSHVEGSWFFSLTSTVFLIAALLAPKALLKWGYLRSYRISLFCLIVSQLIFFSAPRFEVFMLGTIFMGWGVGILSVLQNVLVIVASPPARLKQLMNGLHANYAAASLLAPLIVSFFYNRGFDFQWVFSVGAFVSFVLFLQSFMTNKILEPAVTLKTSFKFLDLIKYMPLAIILSSYVAAEVLVSSRLAFYLTDVHGFNMQKSSLWVSYFFIALLCGRLLFTAVSVSLNTFTLLFSLLILSLFFIVFGIQISPVFLILTGFLMGPIYAMTMTLVKEYFPAQIEKVTSLSIVMSGVFIIAMHTLVGIVTDTWGISLALFLAPGLLLLAIVMLLYKKYVY